ncbi:hypothetical protein HAPAU_36270 [Halalkalicoccus paucihalophilus]|uniref:Uncharacterized protein n=1 Tax=Halalkalicoccus paucihalophilus TaxID=1008153 RepID=A0A151AAL9_9EURY|nr:hypothetical protein [Halalkalicoccus paucihalophilus]KYH24644.1 hypothetical protein HAPAU_36270 [Halalkalicoccus paucihalophilus]
MNPRYVDAVVDLAYGVVLFSAIALIVMRGTETGLAFGFGVLVSYAIHVVWKMARFDPDWMTRTVEETVEQTVGKTVEEAVEQDVEEQVGTVQEQIKTIEQRVERRPREDEVEELIEETVENDAQGRSDS